MNVLLKPTLQARVDEKLRNGEFESAEVLFEEALTYFFDGEQREPGEEEFRESKAAIDEALEQGERGEGRPAENVFADLRTKYGVSR